MFVNMFLKEKTATMAERDSIKFINKILKNKIGDVFNGIILD